MLKEQIRKILPRTQKSRRILAGPLRGAYIYTSWYDYPGAILGTTEKLLLEWFGRNVSRGETWIDAGAHYGYTAIALCRLVGPTGRVVAFEPVLSTAGCIARTRAWNGLAQLQVVPLGLASCPKIESRRLPLVRGMADSTISRSTISRSAWEEPISVASFDTIWRYLSEENPAVHGVKIDVQGMELEVIEGMRHTLLSQHPKLIIEFHPGVDRARVLDLLSCCGYKEPGSPIDSATTGSLYQDDKSYLFLKECECAALSVS